MKQDIAEILLSAEQLDEITTRLAEKIKADYAESQNELVLVCILKGSVIFTADLMRKIGLPLSIEFMKVSSYGAGTKTSGEINIQLDIRRKELGNADILIVEDIIDSGRTLYSLTEHFRKMGVGSVKCCTLLDKPSRREVDFRADYVGTEIPDKFVIGYGLDYNENYRNLPFVGVLDPSVYM